MEIYKNSKPYTRWWWFSGEIRDEDILAQLEWVKQNGFGGVEIAWVYPQLDAKPGPAWLSAELSDHIRYAKQIADELGLGCDFTFGTSWPFGGSSVSGDDASRDIHGLSSQRLEKSWEWPIEGNLVNHLDQTALKHYSRVMGNVLTGGLQGSPSALFCDSWEVLTEGLWTSGFGELFQSRFGYAIEPLLPDLNQHPDVRYDYRSLISDLVLQEFYRPYATICRELGGFSRVQCHGAPTDLLSAYAAVDVPESEAILFDPEFSNIAASAAALTGKKIVSAETFTCMYGWVAKPGPGQYQGKEQITDLKMLADAMFANGINQVFWHGMPYNPPGGSNRFYATTHVGPDSHFIGQLPGFNDYMTRVSAALREGTTYSDVAVYMPIEDARMQHELPEALRKPSAFYHWEMHYARFPEVLKGFRPLWVSTPFLKTMDFQNGLLTCGHHEFKAIYVDVDWLDRAALHELLRLARLGAPICIRRRLYEPGLIKSDSYESDYRAITSLHNVSSELGAVLHSPRLVSGNDVPDFWCRKLDGDMLFFFAHPAARGLRYPLSYGQSKHEHAMQRDVEIRVQGKRVKLELHFAPYQSILLRVSAQGNVEYLDIANDLGPDFGQSISGQ